MVKSLNPYCCKESNSWFQHSGTLELFRRIADKGCKVIITTDHGTIRVDNPQKVVGDKNTNTNLRYKVGKNLSYNMKEVFEIRDPEKAGLPSPNLSSKYIFATNNDFFAYPNNYNYYVSYYRNTFQHATDLIVNKQFGRMVCVKNGTVDSIPLSEVASKLKLVTADNDLIIQGSRMGISFGH